MSKSQEIHDRVQAQLSPHRLEVDNQSAQHHGHAGDDGSGESHFHLIIRAEAFEGKSRIARHRMVHAVLGKELVSAIHALSLDLDT